MWKPKRCGSSSSPNTRKTGLAALIHVEEEPFRFGLFIMVVFAVAVTVVLSFVERNQEIRGRTSLLVGGMVRWTTTPYRRKRATHTP